MDSAFTYIGSLVDAFEDVGNGDRTKKSNDTTPVCHEMGLPTCALDISNSAEDYSFDNDDLNDLELQQQHDGKLRCFEDEGGGNDYDSDSNEYFASNTRSHRKLHKKMHNMPSHSDKQTVSRILKSKSREIASRVSLLQSFSELSGNENDVSKDPPDVSKSRSSLSDTTKETDDVGNDDSDFSWADSLSSNGGYSRKYTKGHRHYLPPPPKHPHLAWFAHGFGWTGMTIGFGWLGFVLSFMARQSTDFVMLKEPMYLDPRYETIPAVGMIQIELCFNETHLDILDELNGNTYLLEPGEEPPRLEIQQKTRMFDTHATDRHEVDVFGPSIVDTATEPCIFHKLNSDDVHDDLMYEVSRSVAFLALAIGAFSTICLTSSVFWKTINLRPIGAGYLVTYFLQSFTFLIFDSNLCADHQGCAMSHGGICSAIASVCWIFACAASSRMDNRKFWKQQLKEIGIEECTGQKYYLQRKAEKSARYQTHPDHISVEKPLYPDTMQALIVREETKKRQKLKEQRKGAYESQVVEVDRMDAKRSNTYAPLVENQEQILEDLKRRNANPIYIPTLPETSSNVVYTPGIPESPPSSSTSINKKSKSRSKSSKPKKDRSIKTHEIEENRESRPTKSKSKQELDDDPVKRKRSKKSKSKSKNKNDRDNEEQELTESQYSFVSTSTKEERKEKPKSSKRKKGEGKNKSQATLDQELLEERPRSSKKSTKHVKGTNGKKKSTRQSTTLIDDTSQHNQISLSNDTSLYPEESRNKNIVGNVEQDQTRKKRSASRPRKSKIDTKPEKAVLREAVRKAIEDGKHYEL